MAQSEHYPTTEIISETILAAALRRFEQFGYSKTTMAEIAADKPDHRGGCCPAKTTKKRCDREPNPSSDD